MKFDNAAEKGAKDYISEVRESSIWVSLRVCSGRLSGHPYGWTEVEPRAIVREICRLVVLSHDKKGGEEAARAPLPEWPSLCFDYCRNFGFDNGCLNQDGYRTWPPLETQESGPELARGNSWCEVEKHHLQRVCCST